MRGGAIKISVACLGSEKTGRITHTRLTVKRHYYYSPDGDMTLFETAFHQPVFGTDEGIDLSVPLYPVFNPDGLRPLRERRPDDRGSDPENKYPAQFDFECRTETGEIMRRQFEFRYRARSVAY